MLVGNLSNDTAVSCSPEDGDEIYVINNHPESKRHEPMMSELSHSAMSTIKQKLIQAICIVTAARVYRKYSMRGCVERLIQHKVKLSAVFALRHTQQSAVFFIHTSIGGVLSVILYFMVFLLKALPEPLQFFW